MRLRSEIGRNFLAAWAGSRGTKLVPTSRDFGPAQMRGVLPYVYVITIQSDGSHKLAICGTALCEWLGLDPTGVDAVAMNPPADRRAARDLHELIIDRPCVSHSLRWFKTQMDRMIVVEQVLVPIAGEDGVVNRLAAVVGDVDDDEADIHFLDATAAERSMVTPLGSLKERTIFDLHTLRPVESDLNVPPLDDARRALRLSLAA